MSFTWGAGKHALARFQQWLEQLPADIMRSRPDLCISCTQMLWTVAQHPMLQIWLDAAEATLTASLAQNASPTRFTLEAQQEQQDLLGEVITIRAVLQSYQEDGPGALALSEQALALLSAENSSIHVQVALAQLIAYYASSSNDAVAAVEGGLRGGLLAQAAGLPAQAIGIMGTTARYMILSLPTSFGTLLRAMVTSQVVLKRPRIISALAILSAGGSKNLWVMIRYMIGAGRLHEPSKRCCWGYVRRLGVA